MYSLDNFELENFSSKDVQLDARSSHIHTLLHFFGTQIPVISSVLQNLCRLKKREEIRARKLRVGSNKMVNMHEKKGRVASKHSSAI